MPYGYNGTILRVDLSEKKIWTENPPENIYRKYLGGSSLALYYLLNELNMNIDPFDPKNIMVLASSVISGAPIAGITRYTVAALSPLTNGFGEAEAGGFWGPELKHAGFDAVIISGKAERPVYLWIHDGEAEIRDASSLWGASTYATQEAIRTELQDKRIRVLSTGLAGENKVRYACLLNEAKHANGRTGMGAVMGSKNLKAVAVRGTRKLEVADPESLKTLAKELAALIESNKADQILRKFGTANLVIPLSSSGILPTKNFHWGSFEGAEAISGEAMTEKILVKPEGCYACSVRCKRVVKTNGKYKVNPALGGPEYETIASLGSCLCIDNLEAIAKGNELCNSYGLDTISTGAVIAFAMECFEEGILTKEDTDGIELRFGNAEAMLEIIERIAHRKGIGDILAEGVMRAAKKIGKGAERFALHVKGQEVPMHDPRGKIGVGIGYAISPTGADHIEATHDTAFTTEKGSAFRAAKVLGLVEPLDARDMSPAKARQFYYLQLVWSLWNCLGVCNFVASPNWALPIHKVPDIVKAITGWDTSLWELLKVGEKSNTMARAFNTLRGFTRSDDRLPDRLYEPLENGPLKGTGIDREKFDRLLEAYYEMVGWDKETGTPTEAKLAELDLGWLVEKLKNAGKL